ncbi:MAG: hypothetical protein NVV63_17095 [Opitutus sp.]|nr:hypothetical protein [Opitutus sp.]
MPCTVSSVAVFSGLRNLGGSLRGVGNGLGLLARELRGLFHLFNGRGSFADRRRRLGGTRGELRGGGGDFVRRRAQDAHALDQLGGEAAERFHHLGEGVAEHVRLGKRFHLRAQIAGSDRARHRGGGFQRLHHLLKHVGQASDFVAAVGAFERHVEIADGDAFGGVRDVFQRSRDVAGDDVADHTEQNDGENDADDDRQHRGLRAAIGVLPALAKERVFVGFHASDERPHGVHLLFAFACDDQRLGWLEALRASHVDDLLEPG